MKLESKWTRGIASLFIRKVLRNKFGYDVDVRLNHFRTTVLEDKAHVHLDIDLELSKEQLDKLMKSIGL